MLADGFVEWTQSDMIALKYLFSNTKINRLIVYFPL